LSEDKDNVTIEFSISDTGIGISKNNFEIIFESFQQASNITSRLYGGTGIGLAIVKQLVEMHGGTIMVDSNVNKGSRFNVNLSFQKTKIENDQKLELEYLNADIKNINVLVVDLSYLSNHTMSDPKMMLGMIAIYMAQTPLLIEAMKKGLENKDWFIVQFLIAKTVVIIMFICVYR
jgi:hypothetical protein